MGPESIRILADRMRRNDMLAEDAMRRHREQMDHLRQRYANLNPRDRRSRIIENEKLRDILDDWNMYTSETRRAAAVLSAELALLRTNTE